MGDFIGSVGSAFGSGGLAGGISNLLGLSASSPPNRSYDKELAKTLNTQIQLAPQVYGAESNPDYGQPAYARLALQNLNILAPGFEDVYGGVTSRSRTRTATDIANIAPGLASTYANLNPNQTQLLSQLNDQARTGLGAGTQLSPEDIARVTQPIRSDWANRGLGPSSAAQLNEGVGLATAGQGLLQQRQQFAQGVAGLNYQNSLPLYDALGRIGTDTSQASNYGSLLNPTLQGLGPLFTPESQYAGDIYNQRYQTTAAINAGNAANNASFLSSIMGMGGAMCWAAREVFGLQDSRWLHFRHWLQTQAPEKLRDWYIANGEQWAVRLRRNPVAKAVVRRWMEARIALVT